MKVFNNLRWLFIKCDLFGKKPKFTIAKRRTFQTEIGAIATLISYGFAIYFIWYFGKEIFLREIPSVVMTSTYDNIPYPIDLSGDRFEIAFSLQTANYTNFIDETIYSVKAYRVTTNRSKGFYETTTKNIPLVRCSQHNFTMLPEYYNTLQLENLYCLKSKKDLMLNGEFDSPEWNYISFEFEQCDMKSKKCSSLVNILETLNGGYLGMFIIDLSITPNDYSEPKKLFGKNIFTAFSNMDYRDIWMYLKTYEINTDVGIMFNDIKHESFFAFDEIKEEKFFTTNSLFLSLRLRTSPVRTIYDRSYMKIQTFAAYAGGIIKFILIIAEILVYWFRELLFKDFILSFYNTEKYNKKIMNNQMQTPVNILQKTCLKNKDYSESIEKTKGIINNSISINKSNTIPIEQSFALMNQLNQSNQVNNSMNKNDINNQSCPPVMVPNRRRLSLLDIIGPCLCNKKRRRKITQIIKQFHDVGINFDIINFLKLQNDVFIIKTQLLNNSQLKLNEIGYTFESGTSISNNIYKYITRRGFMHERNENNKEIHAFYSSYFNDISNDKDNGSLNWIILNSVKTIKDIISVK